MSDYVRPTLPSQVFYDNRGAVIDYGNRWRGESPPEDTYSVVTNAQRYGPLHLVADALIQHLATNFAVEVSEDSAFAGDLLHDRNGVMRAVRVVPVNRDEAALTFVFTSFPGVAVHAGLLHDFAFPDCGCDACDESVERVADELEWAVLCVVAGGFSEWVDPDAMLAVGHELSSGDGTRRRSGVTAQNDPPRLQVAAERLSHLPGGWQPWSLRA